MAPRKSYNLSPEQIDKMTRAQLVKIVNQAASTANKRIRRIEQQGYVDQSLIYMELRDARISAKFSVAGKDKLGLVQELMYINRFLADESSTITGIKNINARFAMTNNGPLAGLNDAQQKRYYNVLSRYKEMHAALFSTYGSERVMRLIEETVADNKKLGVNQLYNRIEKIIDETAERNQLNFRGSEDGGYWLP